MPTLTHQLHCLGFGRRTGENSVTFENFFLWTDSVGQHDLEGAATQILTQPIPQSSYSEQDALLWRPVYNQVWARVTIKNKTYHCYGLKWDANSTDICYPVLCCVIEITINGHEPTKETNCFVQDLLEKVHANAIYGNELHKVDANEQVNLFTIYTNFESQQCRVQERVQERVRCVHVDIEGPKEKWDETCGPEISLIKQIMTKFLEDAEWALYWTENEEDLWERCDIAKVSWFQQRPTPYKLFFGCYTIWFAVGASSRSWVYSPGVNNSAGAQALIDGICDSTKKPVIDDESPSRSTEPAF